MYKINAEMNVLIDISQTLPPRSKPPSSRRVIVLRIPPKHSPVFTLRTQGDIGC